MLVHGLFRFTLVKLKTTDRLYSTFSCQAKDKVIASLRDGSSGEVTSGISSSEYEEVCHERDMFKDEVNQIKYKMEQLKADLQVMNRFNLKERP